MNERLIKGNNELCERTIGDTKNDDNDFFKVNISEHLLCTNYWTKNFISLSYVIHNITYGRILLLLNEEPELI